MTDELGEIIRRKREDLRISQQAVAYALDISQAAYSKIERGETEVKVKHLYRIAAYLNLSVYELLPPSMASEVMGDYLLAPLVHRVREWWYQRSLVSTRKGVPISERP
ncbi:helix-turn-helix domain-containing protein [Olivibacter sitiensis]|uniref:helix-turn-helix domain-containing protein n=1 Tax=Olivibacter sitiensis TaxID=376470 RepID=UPI0004266745|nr:helix-turn-helix transcriptional regulator [Olivibacter sitiensis]